MKKLKNLLLVIVLLSMFISAFSLAQEKGGVSPGDDKGKAPPSQGQGAPAETLPPKETGLTEGPQEELSEEQEFQQLLEGRLKITGVRRLQRYGDSFFKVADVTSTEVSFYDVVPVGTDYVVGPGDELRVTVWGMIQGDWRLVVDRSGKIHIPGVGTFSVAGVRFGELKGVLRREISKYYSNFELDVEMGALRNIRVYVTGNAKKPGAYIIPSLSTLVNALLIAGGPDFYGSMRKIEVKRDGKTISVFDMYEFLMKGDKSKDVRLMSEDVVFIPTVGPMVAIIGDVKRPGIYELKGGETLSDLIELAGGMTATGGETRIVLRRVIGREYITFFEGDLKEISPHSLRSLILKDGDFVRVFPVAAKDSTIELRGAVFSPGMFYIERGKTRLSEVIKRAGGVLREAGDLVEVTRTLPTSKGPKCERLVVNLKKVLEGDPSDDILLEHGDIIVVSFIPDWRMPKMVSIRGEVMRPGDYPIHEGERLSDLIERAGGFTHRAYLKGAVLLRESVRRAQEEQIRDIILRMQMELASATGEEVSTALTQEDVKLYQVLSDQRRRLLDLMSQVRPNGRVIVFVAEPKVLRGTPYDIPLEPGDSLYIPAKPDTVQVMGAVMSPGAFLFDQRLSYKDYIAMAGGYTMEADPARIYILKANGVAVRLRGQSSYPSWVKEYGSFESEKTLIEPGDTIVVPIKVKVPEGLRKVRDYIDIIYKLAISVLAIERITD